MKYPLPLLALIAVTPAIAEDNRQLDAHEHGVGALNIAIENTIVAMEFHAPGADIVGFEYAAESDADLASIEAALAALGAPLDLFVMPAAAGCTVVDAKAELEGDEAHHDHDDHDDEKHDDHGHDDHAEDKHDDHADEKHDDHGHDDHADEASHTEFHAEYTLDCDNPDALTEINFAYFDSFSNAQEVEVQIITQNGAQAFEVERASPLLDLGR